MGAEAVQERMREKSARKSIEIELQHGYSLSPVEAQILANRVEQLIDERLGRLRQEGQITYQAIAADDFSSQAGSSVGCTTFQFAAS